MSKSSISAWVKDLPKPKPRWKKVEQMQRLDTAHTAFREDRDAERRRLTREATQEIGEISDRELFLIGVGPYWAEGSKDKEYARRESLTFINSDPRMIQVYVRRLGLLGVDHHRMRCSLHIHDSADISEATRFWSEITGVPAEDSLKPGIRIDNPGTNHLNRGDTYRGCLRIYVTNRARLYRQVEGRWRRISTSGSTPATDGTSGIV
ncbi:hypothetical protein [Streptomyces pinistramenti]|uniref:hypothetical protein n=1 Tax=Streptomyces pinistramenti TaxID=2884812 RepID=UPI001D088940|nr:hypothetical protein [Streptomyces pinistramenti]MCB5907595.1 hypothetical protein [Streptomyces pinistramenti]